jgi:hypothetical protein
MRKRSVAGLAGLPALALLLACASPPPLVAPVSAAAPADLPPSSDIRECLFASRRPVSEGVDSGMVLPGRYNACMRDKGWRGGDAG